MLSAFIESPEELVALAANAQAQYDSPVPVVDEDEPEEPQHQFTGCFGRDYEPDFTAFADRMRADAIAHGAPLPSRFDIVRLAAYENKRQEREQTEYAMQIAERDRHEVRQRIAADCVRFTSSIKSHVAFDKIHAFVMALQCSSRPSYGAASLSADLWIAARHALKDEPMLWAFYRLWASGAAADIAPGVLAKSEHWYRVRSLVGEEVLRRELLNGYFIKRRFKSSRRWFPKGNV